MGSCCAFLMLWVIQESLTRNNGTKLCREYIKLSIRLKLQAGTHILRRDRRGIILYWAAREHLPGVQWLLFSLFGHLILGQLSLKKEKTEGIKELKMCTHLGGVKGKLIMKQKPGMEELGKGKQQTGHVFTEQGQGVTKEPLPHLTSKSPGAEKEQAHGRASLNLQLLLQGQESHCEVTGLLFPILGDLAIGKAGKEH